MTRIIIGLLSGIFVNLAGFLTGAITPLLLFQQKLEAQGHQLPEIYMRAGSVVQSSSYRATLFGISAICGIVSGLLLVKIIKKKNDRAVLTLAAISSFLNYILWSRTLPLLISFILSLAVFFAILAGAWIAERGKAQPEKCT